MLVGCKKDLRNDPTTIAELKKMNQKPVEYEQVWMISMVNDRRKDLGRDIEKRRSIGDSNTM